MSSSRPSPTAAEWDLALSRSANGNMVRIESPHHVCAKLNRVRRMASQATKARERRCRLWACHAEVRPVAHVNLETICQVDRSRIEQSRTVRETGRTWVNRYNENHRPWPKARL